MYNEKSRTRPGEANRLSDFYAKPPEEEQKSRDLPGKKNSGLGKLNRLFSGDKASSLTSLFSGTLANIKDDDVLLLLIVFLLFNENREDDYLVLIVLGALLLS